MSLPAPQTSENPPEKLLVRGRHGFYMVLAEDLIVSLSLMYYGEYHEHEWQFLKRFIARDQVIVDAGANLGTFTVPFAHAVGPRGKVIAFEPQPVIFDCLKTAIALNKLVNVELHNCCVGEEETALEIFEPDYSKPGNFSGVPFRENDYRDVHYSQNSIRSRCVRLDDVLKENRFDLLKIDVEGMELEVLQGAGQALAAHRPVIYLENNRPKKSPPIIAFLQEFGYRMWWHTGPLFNPHNFAGRPDNIYGKMHNVNMICLPPGADAALISPGMLAVKGADDHIMTEAGQITPSPADDVDGK